MWIVPKLFPPFPEHPYIALYAKLDPALEVGGDLYDFSLLDERHFARGDFKCYVPSVGNIPEIRSLGSSFV